MDLNTILIILGVVALVALVAHGIWSNRRERTRYFQNANTFTQDSRQPAFQRQPTTTANPAPTAPQPVQSTPVPPTATAFPEQQNLDFEPKTVQPDYLEQQVQEERSVEQQLNNIKITLPEQPTSPFEERPVYDMHPYRNSQPAQAQQIQRTAGFEQQSAQGFPTQTHNAQNYQANPFNASPFDNIPSAQDLYAQQNELEQQRQSPIAQPLVNEAPSQAAPAAQPVQNVDPFATQPASYQAAPTVTIKPAASLAPENEPTTPINVSLEQSTEIEAVENGASAAAEPVQEHTDSQSSATSTESTGFVMLYVVAPENRQFAGVHLAKALDDLGFLFGERHFYHRHLDLSSASPILFSVANIQQPGTFSPYDMDSFSTVGVALFMQLPSQGNDRANLKMMIRAARTLADELGGYVLTDQQDIFDDLAEQQYLARVA